MKDIRGLYESFGAENYYQEYGNEYKNPHEKEVQELVKRHFSRWDTSGGVLDFCAGSGEVTRALLDCGCARVAGSDPYTFGLYEKNTGITCARWSFDDLLRGADMGRYSLMICSFALHLCPEKDLFPVVWQLFAAAPVLAIITPHKRPELEKLPGVHLLWEDFELTPRGKKVRLKVYDMPGHG